MDSRAKQAQIAGELQALLGSDYAVRFDDCDSGLTRVYFKPLHKLIKEVPNDAMVAGLNVTNFTACREDIMHANAIRMMQAIK